MAAMGAGMDDAFVFREARQNHVEEAAKSEAKERGEDCADQSYQVDRLEFAIDCGFAPVAIG